MSPVSFCCIICGVAIHDRCSSQDPWLRQFRIGEFSPEAKAHDLPLTSIVYAESGAVYVSGVGLREDARSTSWFAPLDEGMRWNDRDYHLEASDRVPVMRQSPVNGRHGFVLHDACWCLLKVALDTESVPLERLFNICESLPFPLWWEGVCWDHDYGGLALIDEQGHYPWEDRLTEPTVYTKVHEYAQANPYDVPGISRLLVMPSDCPPGAMPTRQGKDCFMRFPWEILEAIAALLPTTDALTLRLTSKSFSRILTSQSFWASRFVPGRERDFVFEMRKVHAFIPKALSRMAFSVVRAGEADYVVGLRLISVGEDDKQLGYRAEGKELFFEVTALRGFAVAVGPRGIRALQVIRDDGTRSPWFGRPRSSPVTERLACTKCITALEVGFDGYKLVTLAVAEPTRPLDQISEPQEPSLQHAALWYPTIPDTDLCLNEASFIGEALSAPGYRPLSWILFGGPKGIYLQHLTQVTVSRLGDLDSIYFHYDTDGIVGQKKLGRRRVTEFSEFMRFPIDGKGGEIITTLATSVERIDREGVYSFYKHGKLSSFKVSAPPTECCLSMEQFT
ncbi:hypothetical protein OEA41_000818 [Lepraria neglecta]|uniref:F-box domain-containing protein n=1 Tax=Lepraria neglecta TaxID=209136 RepID=A0AAD9ZGH2_9LECA|nr:hypothetical protein OEA41_000818 [Lepraria neglecta]